MVASVVNSAYKQENGLITFSIVGPVWQSVLDFSAGWFLLDLTIAMELRSVYSMRFFEIARQYHDTHFWHVSNFYEFQQIFNERAIEELEETFQYISSCRCRPQENIGWYIQNIKKKVENKKNELTNKQQ